MSSVAAATLLAAGGYLIGSLSFAVIVSRLMGLPDPRQYGSGNPGATNVLRSGSRVAALLTLAGDAFKGWLAVWIAQRYGPDFGVGEGGTALVAVAVFGGHLFPLFFHFKGGKGVATAAGVILALNPWLGLACALTWLLIAVFFRYSSLASLVAAIFAVVYQAFAWGFGPTSAAIAVIAGLIVYRHRTNIANLVAGRERRLGARSDSTPPVG